MIRMPLKPLPDERQPPLHFAGRTRDLGAFSANASFGFPQHIRGYLQGADAAIRRHGHLRGEGLKDALAQDDANRTTYYEQRLAAMGKGLHLLAFGIPSFRTYMIAQAAAYREVARRGNSVKSATR